MDLGPCRVGLCNNISSFMPIISKNWSFLPHLILETKIAHHTITSRMMFLKSFRTSTEWERWFAAESEAGLSSTDVKAEEEFLICSMC